jgi:hypothetical protein
MKIENEDIIFGILALVLLGIWLLTLLIFESALASIAFLWTTMILLSLLYVYVYRKRKRNMKILRRRFFVSAIPLYPMLIYYVYKIIIEHNLPEEQKFLPLFIVFMVLILNGIVLYVYEIK